MSAVTPFAAASALSPHEDGYTVTLDETWSVGDKPHGGYLVALLGSAGASVLGGDPLAVSAQFLRPPELDEVLLRADVRKKGRTAGVVHVSLEQGGRSCVEATVTTGRLPEPGYAELPDLPAEPVPDAVEMGGYWRSRGHHISRTCDVRLDPADASFLRGGTDGPLRMRLWTRPPDGAQPDPLFALVAGDVNIPLPFNLGRLGWSPTVQLTALLRARPAPGWLRVEVTGRAMHGDWFDSDATVLDSAGTLVCQARQLALAARLR